MSEPIDNASRSRFVSEIDRNFSVIASAGSGKTRAITDRIVEIALSKNALAWLPNLVVVTFTNRAADEMQQRARQKILEARVSLEVLAAFNRAFFGTIHSFCVKLLANHGHHLGLPAKLDLITDDEELWSAFVQTQSNVTSMLSPGQRKRLLRFVQVRKLMELGRRGGLEAVEAADPGDCPELNCEELFAQTGKGSSVLTIQRSQEQLRQFCQMLAEGDGFLPLPTSASKAKEFHALWQQTIEPLRGWINCCSLKVAVGVERAWREFRLEKGALTYHDQIALARDLLCHPEAGRRIREKNYRVILDEAQDTDPLQFSVLLEVSRPAEADRDWLASREHPPRDGYFCMVGDFQQSIFGDRADLQYYRKVHDTLVNSGAGEALEFSVTFRLDSGQIDFVNESFRALLNNRDGQVDFVKLNPRSDVLPGQVVRLEFDTTKFAVIGNEISDRRGAEFEAAELAKWLRATGLKNLRANSWREVAIICPRKKWFRPLGNALRREGFAVQIQSESQLRGDSPACAWFTALVVIMAEPFLGYEIVGVLREVFGLADHDLALFSEGDGNRFQIARITATTGIVADKLNQLAQIRAAIETLPLFTAMEEMVKVVQLRARLNSLPTDEFSGLEAELDTMLATAAAAEADGKTLVQFAENLRANFDSVRDAQPAVGDVIQLITGQKAKGSEWHAVIVPFLSRRVYDRSAPYPRVIRTPGTGELVIVLDAEGMTAELNDALKLSHRQEMERLLYVALTRAKHTLVLAADREIFANAKGKLSDTSQTKWMRCDTAEQNLDTLMKLPVSADACAVTQTRQQDDFSRKSDEQKVAPLPRIERGLLPEALRAGSRFVQKLSPSGFGGEPPEPLAFGEPESAVRVGSFDNPATRFGTWWHEFVERLSWDGSLASMEEVFEADKITSPDPARSTKEWGLLRAHFATNSPFAQRLSRRGSIAHSEMPFFWRMNQRACLEGIIDLAIFDPAAGKCLIVDWKTNRIAPRGVMHLCEQYRPQLAAYWRAVTAMTGLEVEAALFATATGEFLKYETQELASAWAELENLPDEQLPAMLAER